MRVDHPEDRIPPQSLEAEQAVLGSILAVPAKLDAVRGLVGPSDMYREAHRHIYEAILHVAEAGREIDILTVQDELIAHDRLEACGGTPYLVQVTDSVPSAANAVFYAEIVSDRSTRRKLIDAGAQVTSIAHSTEREIADVLGRCEEAVTRVREGHERLGDPFSAGMVAAANLPEPQPVQRIWLGFYAATVHLMNGETGSGKSSFLYNLALHAARNEDLYGVPFGLGRPVRVLYIDPENAGSYRNSALDGGLCMRKMRRILGADAVPPPTLVFHDGAGMNLRLGWHIDWLRRAVKRGIGGEPFDLVIFDTLVALFGLKDENDNAEGAAIASSMRSFSRDTGACVIAVHHTGKATLQQGVLSGRGNSALPGGADVVSTFRRKGPDPDETDEEYQGCAQRCTQYICRLRLEKDRLAEFGQGASLYVRMMGDDRFSRCSFSDWKEAKRVEAESKVTKAQNLVLDYLRTVERATQQEIGDRLRQQDIGSRYAYDATKALVESQQIFMRRAGRGGTCVYSLSKFCTLANTIGPDFCETSESVNGHQQPSGPEEIEEGWK